MHESKFAQMILNLVYNSCTFDVHYISSWEQVGMCHVSVSILKCHGQIRQIALSGVKCLYLFLTLPCSTLDPFQLNELLVLLVDIFETYILDAEICNFNLLLIQVFCSMNCVVPSVSSTTKRIRLLGSILASKSPEDYDLTVVANVMKYFSSDSEYGELLLSNGILQSLRTQIHSYNSLPAQSILDFILAYEALSNVNSWTPCSDNHRVIDDLISLVEVTKDMQFLQIILPILAKVSVTESSFKSFELVCQQSISYIKQFPRDELLVNSCLLCILLLFSFESEIERLSNHIPVSLLSWLYMNRSILFVENLLSVITILGCIKSVRNEFLISDIPRFMIYSLQNPISFTSECEPTLNCLLSLLRVENNSRELSISDISPDCIQIFLNISVRYLIIGTSHKIVMPLCRILSEVFNKYPEFSITLQEQGVFDHIISLLQYYAGNDQIEISSSIEICGLIKSLCHEPSNFISLIGCGLLDVVVDVMESSCATAGSTILLSDIVEIFMKETPTDRIVFQDAVGQSGIFKSIVQALDKHKTNFPILLHLLYVINSLSYQHKVNCELLMEHGISHSLINILQIPTIDLRIFSEVGQCLISLLSHSLESSFIFQEDEIGAVLNQFLGQNEITHSISTIEIVVKLIDDLLHDCVRNRLIFCQYEFVISFLFKMLNDQNLPSDILQMTLCAIQHISLLEPSCRNDARRELSIQFHAPEIYNSLVRILTLHSSEPIMIQLTLWILSVYLQGLDICSLQKVCEDGLNSLLINLFALYSRNEEVVVPLATNLCCLASLPENVGHLDTLKIIDFILDTLRIHRNQPVIYNCFIPIIFHLVENETFLSTLQESSLCEWLIPLMKISFTDGSFFLKVLQLLKILMNSYVRNISLFTQLGGEQILLDALLHWQHLHHSSVIYELCYLQFLVYQHLVQTGRTIHQGPKSCEYIVKLLVEYGEDQNLLSVIFDLLQLLCQCGDAEILKLQESEVLNLILHLLNSEKYQLDIRTVCLIGLMFPFKYRHKVYPELYSNLIQLNQKKHVILLIMKTLLIENGGDQTKDVCSLCSVLLLLCDADPKRVSINIPSSLLDALELLTISHQSEERIIIHIFAVISALAKKSFSHHFIHFAEIATPLLLNPSVTIPSSLYSKYSLELISILGKDAVINTCWAQAGVCGALAKTLRECQLHSDFVSLRMCCEAISTLCEKIEHVLTKLTYVRRYLCALDNI
jgi:hypothetical protein